MKRTRLKVKGTSTTATVKQEIQDTLRAIVIARDGGCILRKVRHCGGELGNAVLQADHLITRANSATYADSRLVVCLCRPCHGGFKKWHEREYNALVKDKETEEIVAHSTTSMGEGRQETLNGLPVTTHDMAEDEFYKVLRLFTAYLKEQEHLKELEAEHGKEMSEEEESLVDLEIKAEKESNI